MKIKTIDIDTKEWFDKVNGNSYFSGMITLNYGMNDTKYIEMQFQYGYGEHYINVATMSLIELGYINPVKHKNGLYPPLWQYSRDNNIILRTSKKENCLKRELKGV